MSSTHLLPGELMRYAPAYVARRLAGASAPTASAFSEAGPAATLFADISGFAALSERMAARGPEGAEALSHILNAYFGTLIDAMNAHGADVARFAGDAVLAYWPLADERGLADAVQLAAQCAADIQRRMSVFESPTGERLALRAGVGAGPVSSFALGGVRDRYECMVTGPAVGEASRAAAATAPGTVAVGPHAWSLLRERATGEPLAEHYTRLRALASDLPTQPLAWPELPPEAAPALLSFVPVSIRERLEAHQSSWLAEIRRVSVIFVNLPALLHEAPLDTAQRAMVAMQEELYRYEGSVNKLGADEKGAMLVAATGLPPLAHEDDEARAALAGLNIHRRLISMGVDASVGVNTGLVFCGTIGNRIRCEYSMLGPVVNMAARLMAAAHGGALCSGTVHERALRRLDWEVLEPVLVKGRAVPVSVFRPLGEARRATPAQPALPMIGREAELARIREVFQHLRGDGRGGVVLIEGEAGIGKSRLVTSTIEAAAELGLSVRTGFAEAVQRATPYFAFRSVFLRLVGLDRASGDRAAHREKVFAELSFDPELVKLAPLLEVVLALDFPENAVTSTLFGAGRVAKTNELLVRLVARAAAMQPMVLVLEDCHWMDSASWALARELAREVGPLALVLATRPLADADPRAREMLESGPRPARIVLEPLSEEHSLALVQQRLGVDELPAALAQVLRTRAQGNPFFTEEVAFALLATGAIRVDARRCVLAKDFDPQTMDLPDTVQGVVMSRIDRLQPRQQLTLKVAAVVGRTFPFEIVRDVCPIPDDRAEQLPILGLLTDDRFVDLDAIEPQRIYSFHHVITQEVAYQLMVPAQRRALHRAVAEWYEANQLDLVPLYPLLAKHWSNTDQVAKALEYFEKSGENALRDHANQEAVEFFSQALALDAQAGRPAGPLRRGTWERMLAEATYNLGHLHVALGHYEKALDLLGHPLPRTAPGYVLAAAWQMLLQLLRRLRPAAFAPTAGEDETRRALEASRAHERLVQVRYLNNAKVETLHAAFAGLNIAETVGDCPELARNHATAAVMTGMFGLHGAARRYAERALQVADKVSHKPTSAYVGFIRGVYWVTVGDWSLAEQDLTQAAHWMLELGDHRHWAETAFTLAQALSRKGDRERALELGVALSTAGQQRGVAQVEVWGLCWRLWCGTALESPTPEASELEAALTRVLERGTDLTLADQIVGFGVIASARWSLGDPLRALTAARTAEAIIQKASPVSQYLLESYSCMSRVYFEQWTATNDTLQRDELESLTASACRTLADYARMYPVGRPRLYLERGRLAWMRHQPDRARAHWSSSCTEADRLRMPREAAQARELLGRVRSA